MKNKKIVFFAPHPDDETLGCGGTILKLKKNNCKIYWVILTKMYHPKWTPKQIEKRKLEILKVKKKYNFNKIYELGFKSSHLDTYPVDELVSSISKVIDNIKPNIIFLNSQNDVHTDHKIAFDAIVSATKSFRKKYIEKLICYETLSETDYNLDTNSFNPNLFIDISQTFKLKCQIMKI